MKFSSGTDGREKIVLGKVAGDEEQKSMYIVYTLYTNIIEP